MTLVLELPAEVEAALHERARERGISVEELALEGVREKTRADEKRAERARILDELQGSLKGKLGSVDDFYAERRLENEREEAKWEAHYGESV